jgi:hypothetical protein
MDWGDFQTVDKEAQVAYFCGSLQPWKEIFRGMKQARRAE